MLPLCLLWLTLKPPRILPCKMLTCCLADLGSQVLGLGTYRKATLLGHVPTRTPP